jgi:hypothetical protein
VHADKGRPQAEYNPVLVMKQSFGLADTGRVDGFAEADKRL